MPSTREPIQVSNEEVVSLLSDARKRQRMGPRLLGMDCPVCRVPMEELGTVHVRPHTIWYWGGCPTCGRRGATMARK